MSPISHLSPWTLLIISSFLSLFRVKVTTMGKSQAQAYERRHGLNRTTHALPYGYICGIQRDKCLRGRVVVGVYAVSFAALFDKSRTVSRDILGRTYGVSGVILGMLGILMNNWVSFVIGINQKIRLVSSLGRPETCSMLKLCEIAKSSPQC